jgi:hypothetical protein
MTEAIDYGCEKQGVWGSHTELLLQERNLILMGNSEWACLCDMTH